MENLTSHFAEDPEKLEAYVLRQLDTDTLVRFDEHVRSCEICRQAVNEERLLAAGVKRYGREQLRERLNARLGAPREGAAGGSRRGAPRERGVRRVPWPHVLSIAAVVIIIVGVGIQQRWFVKYVEQENLVTSKQVQLEGPAEEAVSSDAAPGSTAARVAAAPEGASQATTQRSTADSRSTVAGYEAHARDGVRRAEEKDAALDVARPSASVAPPESGGRRQEFWTGGTLITGTRARDRAHEAGRMKQMMKKEAAAAGRAQGEPETLGNVTLEQRPVSSLPETQQRQQLYDPGTIQTLVRQTERETQLTLFPASPFDSTQLHYARVQQVAPDSIIVQVGDQQIGYRLPAPTLRQMQLQLDTGKTPP